MLTRSSGWSSRPTLVGIVRRPTISRRAVILAGGKGSRLKPYTVVLPKPLMPVGDYPILEIIVRQLVSHGFDHITFTVNHQAELIRAFFGDGSRWQVKLDYSFEETPLSTMGPLRLLNDLPENFLVMNGDVLTDLDFSEFYQHHVDAANLFTISSAMREQVEQYGVLEVDGEGRLTGFYEKPLRRYEVSMGVYMLNCEVVSHIPHGQAYGFDHLMEHMLAADVPVAVRRHAGYWLDIGRPDDFARATQEFEAAQERYLPS